MKKKKKQATEAEKCAEVEQADLFGDAENTPELKISQSFAKKYNEKKDHEELIRGQKILAEEDHGSESSEEEDEDAELLTKKVGLKIFETLNKIKSKDPSIYDNKHTFFSEKDFEKGTTASSSSGEKKVTYKDLMRKTLLEDGADAIGKEEEELHAKEMIAKKKAKKKGLTPMEEQKELKAAIVAAAFGGSDDEDDGDVFTLKKKSAEEVKEEDQEFHEFNLWKDKEPKSHDDADDIIGRYWKSDEDLNEGDQFLRDYLLNEGWKETASLQADAERGAMDAQSASASEEEHLDDVDEFEKDYNFRFEVDEGRQIQGHARFQEASVRERPEKRRRQRKEKAERQDAEKIRRTEELKRLKNLKKEEIRRRLQQLKDITGNAESGLGALDLDGEFNPDKHDQDMAKLLGEDFDDQEEALAADDLVQAPAGCKADLDVSAAAEEVQDRRRKTIKKGRRQGDDEAGEDAADGGWDNEADAEAGAPEDTPVEPGLWFLCDACQRGIPGGKKRFDCTVCEDYVLCAKCFRVRRHPHKFVRRKVPETCKPPEAEQNKEASREDVDMDEYFQLDYEDIIGGDLPTRFKYRTVESANFGLRPADILEKSDQELNRLIPLKKLRTYRDEGGGEGGRFRAQKGERKQNSSWQAPNSGASSSSGLSASRLSAYGDSVTGSSGGGKKRKKT